jgi:predicted RNA-binding Zn-ribbon protein involved in translation (DUF1610 family)
MVHSIKCPECGRSARLYRSHTRSGFERAIRKLTPYQVYRCHDCNWRGWLVPSGHGGALAPGFVFKVGLIFLIGLCVGALFTVWISAN